MIGETLRRLVTEHEGNWSDSLADRYYDAPFVKFASGDDPLFEEYKQIIGPWHRTPREAFEAAFGAGSWRGGTVISWASPYSKALRDSNRQQKERPSREWAQAYYFSSKIMQKQVRSGIVDLLARHGHRGVAPADSGWFSIVDTPSGKSSTWSERHAAYAAGLGTFGRNDGFISEKGMAVMLNSVITDAVFAPDGRTAEHHLANCLLVTKNSCGACIRRCPAGAISRDGHDKKACQAYAYGEESVKLAASYGVQGPAGCALCMVNVPCEFANPCASGR